MALHRLQSLGGPRGQSLPHAARARVQGIRIPNGSNALPLTSLLRADIPCPGNMPVPSNQGTDDIITVRDVVPEGGERMTSLRIFDRPDLNPEHIRILAGK